MLLRDQDCIWLTHGKGWDPEEWFLNAILDHGDQFRQYQSHLLRSFLLPVRPDETKLQSMWSSHFQSYQLFQFCPLLQKHNWFPELQEGCLVYIWSAYSGHLSDDIIVKNGQILRYFMNLKWRLKRKSSEYLKILELYTANGWPVLCRPVAWNDLGSLTFDVHILV